MIDYYGQLAVFGAGAAIGAAEITLLMLFLQQREYLRLAISVVAGMILMRLLQGALLGVSPRLDSIAAVRNTGVPSRPGLLVLVGVLLLVSAVMQARKKKSDNSGDRLSSIMRKVGPVAAGAIGMVLVLVNVKAWGLTLAAVESTKDVTDSVVVGALNFIFYALLASMVLLIPILIQVLFPNQSERILTPVSEWLKRNGNLIVAAVTGLIGFYLLARGLNAIL
jgi:hypothetical protein